MASWIEDVLDMTVVVVVAAAAGWQERIVMSFDCFASSEFEV
jgi:hypothetical protein